MSDLTDAEPFEVLKGADETNGEFVRLVSTLHPSPDAAEREAALPHSRWAADNADEHIHPNQTERMKVRSGTYCVEIEGVEYTLTEGEEITLPANTPHRHWNPTDRPIRVVKEDRPARNSEAFFRALYALAQAGETGDDGLPGILQFAVIQDEFPGHAYMTDLPIGVQKTLFSVLAPVGRFLGYRATPPFGRSSREDAAS